MSGPETPGRESEEPDSARGLSGESDPGSELSDDAGPAGEHDDEFDSDPDHESLGDDAGVAAAQPGETDAYSRAYSAPESEHFITGPYLPADMSLYDYDSYDESSDHDDEDAAPRWPWVVGVAAIVAAIALVVSVSLLVAGTDTSKLANPGTTTPRPSRRCRTRSPRPSRRHRLHRHHRRPAPRSQQRRRPKQ